MPKKIVTENGSKLVSIDDLFHDKNELYRDILLWATCKGFTTSSEEFSYTELGNWLIATHRPFVIEFKGSRMSKSYRTHSKQTFIKGRITKLIGLDLIQLNGKRATKNRSETETYQFTSQGLYLAWLINARKNVGSIREESISKLFEILIYYFQESKSAFSQCISSFLLRCKDYGFFSENFNNYSEFFSQLLPKVKEYDTTIKLMLIAITCVDGLGALFIETLKTLDKETQKLALLQIKLDIEGYLDFSTNKEWEIMRFNNIQNYNNVTLTNICHKCKHEYPIQLDIYNFIESIELRLGTSKQAMHFQEMGFSCTNCGSSNRVNPHSKCYTSWFNSKHGTIGRGLPVVWNSC